jgi:hypothetical protein
MKSSAERTAELERKLEAAANGGSVRDIAQAIVTSIDEALRERGRPGKRDREAEGFGYRPGR